LLFLGASGASASPAGPGVPRDGAFTVPVPDPAGAPESTDVPARLFWAMTCRSVNLLPHPVSAKVDATRQATAVFVFNLRIVSLDLLGRERLYVAARHPVGTG
jgi:hypothetical protein